MIKQTIFQPNSVVGSDGWIETGAPVTGPPQPPNRTLPAPIFDVGIQYQPNNGATGRWVIQKTIVSDVAGPGFLDIPAGTFPTAGGIFADDQTVQIRLNGVAVPFTGLGTGNVPVQSVPVTWLAGNNVIEMEVNNTVAGGTAITGMLVALGAGLPCDCCPTGPPQCAQVGVQFSGVAETVSQAGWNQADLPSTIDGNTGNQICGYNSTAGVTPSTTLRVTYTNGTPQNRIRGLRLWNNGGSDLNDADGLNAFTAEFYAGATLLATLPCTGGNGAAPFTFLLPGGQELNGVTSVVLRNLGKQTGSTVSPLWRELQQVQLQSVFPCRRRSGAVEWYDANGVAVAAADVVTCDSAGAAATVPDFRMNGGSFGDGPDPAGENICNVVPAPTSTTGFAAPVGGCYDPTTGSVTMSWGELSSVEMEYGNPPQTSGGVTVQFLSPTLGTITWPTNIVWGMTPGEQRTSNVFGGGRRAVLTYISGPVPSPTRFTIRMIGGASIDLHATPTDNAGPPIRFRIDIINA